MQASPTPTKENPFPWSKDEETKRYTAEASMLQVPPGQIPGITQEINCLECGQSLQRCFGRVCEKGVLQGFRANCICGQEYMIWND